MNRPAIGVITIGQSPRSDMLPEMLPLWGAIEVRQAGALDDLTADEIAALPQTGDELLTSKLRDGSSATFTRAAIVERIQQRIDELEATGVQANLLVCTGTFPPLRHTKPLFAAEPLVVAATQALVGKGKLGIVCPLEEQRVSSIDKFDTPEAVTAIADPYHDGVAGFHNAAASLLAAGATLIVLDCMGYTEQHRSWIRHAVVAAGAEVPVVLSRTAVARLFAEALSATTTGEVPSSEVATSAAGVRS